MDKTKIKDIKMVSVYSSDYQKAFDFYAGTLGLDGGNNRDAKGCYININENNGLYLEGGYEKNKTNDKSARQTFTFGVDSAGAMYNKLKDASITMIQREPVQMGENIYWFQCFDYEGSIVEFLGGL